MAHDLPYRRRRRSTLRLLFSTDYSEYVTTRLLRAGYRSAILTTVLTVVLWVWTALSLPAWIGWGIPTLLCIFAIVGGLSGLATLRVAFEYLTVIFAIAEKVHDLDTSVTYIASVTHQTHTPPPDDTPHPTDNHPITPTERQHT